MTDKQVGIVAAADRAHGVVDLVDAWFAHPALTDLLMLFGETPSGDAGKAVSLSADVQLFNETLPSWVHHVAADPTATLAGVPPKHLDTLRRALAAEQIAAEKFNFRAQGNGGYVERAKAALASFPTKTSERILVLCDQLGLVTPKRPQFTGHSATLILGGGYRRPIRRAQHARELRDKGFDLGWLSFLGSGRPLIEEPAEGPVVVDYAVDAVDEFDLLIGAAKTAFKACPAPPRFLCGCVSAEVVCPLWRDRFPAHEGAIESELTHEREADLLADDGHPMGSVLSASTGRPPHRPNTADTLVLWTRNADVCPGQRVLVVTSQYFVPFQRFDCLRLLYLAHGVQPDVVGFDDRLANPAELPGYLLMETLSAIRSARRLLVDAIELLFSVPEPACARGGAHDDRQ